MADSKWIDPWAFADWTDTSKRPLFSHVWDALKEAADERQALAEFCHSGDFDSDNTFPDFNTDRSIFFSTTNTPNNMIKIKNAVWPVGVPETDDFQSSGTVTANSPANLYTLSEILTDEFSYGSGTLISVSDTDAESVAPDNAIALFSWVIQWFQVMNYPVYYLRRLKNNATGNQFYSALEVQEVTVDVDYGYDVSPFSFNYATAYVTKRTSGAVPTPVDVYVTNDLSESGSPSTPQQVRDYTISTWQNNNSTWWSNIGHDLGDKENSVYLRENTASINFASGTHQQRIQCKIIVYRVRFKTNDDYRATSPNRYDTPKYWNGYYSGVGKFCVNLPAGSPGGTPPTPASYSAFGTGIVNNDVEFTEMTEDVNNYYNIEVANPDFDVEPVMGFPPDPGFNKGVSDWTQEFYLQAVQLEAGTTLSSPFKVQAEVCNQSMTTMTNSDTSIYVKANTTDGNNFEYYTPAP